MRLLTSAVATAIAVGLLAGCSGSNLGSSSSSLPGTGSTAGSAAASHQMHGPSVTKTSHGVLSLVPAWARPAGVAKLGLGRVFNPDKKSKEIYASAFYGTTVYGYKNPNSSNSAPNCTISGMYYVNGIGSDTKGELLVPTGYPSAINVFKKKGCGNLDWSASDPNGQAADAASIKASSKVIVGDILNFTSISGGITPCTKSGGCGAAVTSPINYGYYGAGVTVAKNGDCWMSTYNASSGAATLIYWAGCHGSGQAVTGYNNSSYGGLFIDHQGNIGAIDAFGAKLYVYKGCNPACSQLSSSTLVGESLFGNLDSKGKTLAVGDFVNSDVDVYAYGSNGALTYSYSFNNGLPSGYDEEAAAFTPTNKP